MYEQFKNNVLDKIIGDGQCVSLVVNNSNAYIEALYPGVNWLVIVPPVAAAKDLAGKGNTHLQWIANDHNNPNQLPVQGDIGVSGPTPEAGYEDEFDNPDGHTWIFDSATPEGYVGLQQNAPALGGPVNLKSYDWKFRPVLGWYHPITPGTAPAPVQTPPVTHTIHLPQTTGPWHLYNVGGPYNPAQAKAVLVPSQFPGGITEKILANRGNGVYTIQTQMFGVGDLWTAGSDVVVS
jgi:hypothetical protein